MNGIFNFIGKLFSGIFGFIGGLLGGKSKSGYYLEIDDAKGLNAAPANSVEPTSKAAAQSKSKATVKTVTAPDLVVTDGKVANAAAGVVGEGNVQPIVAEIAQVTQTKATKAKLPVSNNGLNLPEPTVTNFATDYLLPIASAGRRRPGANMRSFLDMAKQVKAAN